MSRQYIPRFKNIDRDFVQRRLADFLRSKEKSLSLIEAEEGKLPQTRHACLAGECIAIGFYRYGLGFPIEEVMASFREAAKAYLAVFQLRGTETTFPVTVLTVDPNKPSNDPGIVLGDRPLCPPDEKDFSLTNSKTGLEAMCSAMISGEYQTARQIADLVWDPPNASYIGPVSEVCTPNEQRYAYAVKHLLMGRQDDARLQIAQFSPSKREWRLTGVEDMLRGIIESDSQVFRRGLDDALSRHRQESQKPSNAWEPEFYLSQYGLAMANLAVRNGAIALEALPHGEVYLPIESI